MKRRDTRVAFFNVKLTDAIEAPPWGTQHRYAPSQQKWASTPNYWEPILGTHVTYKMARKLIQTMLDSHKGPAFYFLVCFEQHENSVQLAFLKTESGADDLLQLSNTRADVVVVPAGAQAQATPQPLRDPHGAGLVLMGILWSLEREPKGDSVVALKALKPIPLAVEAGDTFFANTQEALYLKANGTAVDAPLSRWAVLTGEDLY